MLRVAGRPGTYEAPFAVRFRESESWDVPPVLEPLGADRPIDVAAILLGDDVIGPAVFLVATKPGGPLPPFPAHGHASDSWRMSLLGSFIMGRVEYAAGDFRFQRGWRTYPSDNFASGPHGGWTVLLFGDRRGTRARPASAGQDPPKLESALGKWAGIRGDQLDPDDSCPESTMVTSAGHGTTSGHVDGCFDESSGWDRDASGRRRLGAVIGDNTAGPLVVLSQVPAGGGVAPAGKIDTDVVRIVVEGSCMIGDREYLAGDLHVQPVGRVDEVVAGPEGLSEVVVFADRRVTDHGGEGWAARQQDLFRSLTSNQPAVAVPDPH